MKRLLLLALLPSFAFAANQSPTFDQMAKSGMVVGKQPIVVAPTTTTITVTTNGTAPSNGDVYAFHCLGTQ